MAKNMTPAHGDLHTAVLMMAVRMADAHADWVLSLNGRASVRDRHRRTEDRQYKALCRLTGALGRR